MLANSGRKEQGCGMSKKVVIIGAGGFGREVLDVVDACNSVAKRYNFLGFIVDPQYGAPGTIVNEKPILGGFDWLAEHRTEVEAICSVGAPELKFRVVERAKKLGVRFCSIVHPNAILTRWLTMGEGVVVTAGCILTNQIRLGDHVHVNLDCTIGHDAVLEDFVTLAPGVHVSGMVTLCRGCYVGTGANIIDRINVGEWSIVGAGATVVRDVPENTTAVGVPARVIQAREPGWHLREG
jgi:sugar O-acyltransferase (sialic acid O-acetyltransferase NeuD family)